MRKIVLPEFVSLDGVMEDPGGAERFEHGGWTRPYWGDDIGQFKYEELFAADALLLGRVTYQGFAKAWPSMKDPQGFADRMNNMSKLVVSSTLQTLEWNNSRLLVGDLVDAVTQVKRQAGQNILIAGSASVAQALMRADLIDEYRFLVYPIVLGSGKRLLTGVHRSSLRLRESKTFRSGVVALVYERQG